MRRPLAALACGGALLAAAPAALAAEPPTAHRIPLASGMPSFAAGRTLGLTRVVIPAGTAIAPHRHPGMQVAYIVSGTLTYTVYRGAITVWRGPADGTQKKVREIRAGNTGAIHAGEWIVETPGDWHSARSARGKATVILLATLLRSKEPAAIPVKP